MAGDPVQPAQRVFTNIIWTRFLDPLRDMLARTYAGRLRVVWGKQKGGDLYLQLSLASPTGTRIGGATGFETRRYTAFVDLVTTRDVVDGESLKSLTDQVEDVRACLVAARDHSFGGTDFWHEGLVESEDYNAATEDDQQNGVTRVRLSYSASVSYLE